MANEDSVLFMRGNGNRTFNDDVWDDTLLIKAYDKAINLAKEEVSKRMGMEVPNSQPKQKSQSIKHSRHSNKPYKKWSIGSPCRAIYSEDGQLYEAVITKIYENSGKCIVKFVGYGNTEKVELSSLLESDGLQSQIAQQKDALADKSCEQGTSESSYSSSSKKTNGIADEKMEYENADPKSYKSFLPSGASFHAAMDTMPPAPPLPPQLMATLPENDADALSSMLMSWYISGFHTGYYHGLKHARSVQEKRKNC